MIIPESVFLAARDVAQIEFEKYQAAGVSIGGALTAAVKTALSVIPESPSEAKLRAPLAEALGDTAAAGNLTPCVPDFLIPFAREIVIQVRASDMLHDPRLTADQGGPKSGDALIEQAWHRCERDGKLPYPPITHMGRTVT